MKTRWQCKNKGHFVCPSLGTHTKEAADPNQANGGHRVCYTKSVLCPGSFLFHLIAPQTSEWTGTTTTTTTTTATTANKH